MQCIKQIKNTNERSAKQLQAARVIQPGCVGACHALHLNEVQCKRRVTEQGAKYPNAHAAHQ